MHGGSCGLCTLSALGGHFVQICADSLHLFTHNAPPCDAPWQRKDPNASIRVFALEATYIHHIYHIYPGLSLILSCLKYVKIMF